MNAAASLLFAVAAIALLGLLLGWVTRSPRFTIERIHIEGDFEHGNLASVRANALPKLQGNFFSLDLARAQAAFQSVPWVRRAMVQRLWPNRLAVRLEEHRVAAWWQVDEGDDKLVNEQGEVFEANPGDVEDEDLPVLAGPAGSSAAVLAMHRRLAPVFGARRRCSAPSVRRAPGSR